MDQSPDVQIPRVIAVARRSRLPWRRPRSRRARLKRTSLASAVRREAGLERARSQAVAVSAR